MKKSLLLTAAMLVSSGAFAGVEHYVLRDGNLVQHLKITTVNKDITVHADVDLDSSDAGLKPCAGQLSGEAKSVDKNELALKKHAEGEASFCELKIHLSTNGAIVEQSKGCANFAPGSCRFSTDGKEMPKIK